MSKAKTKAYIFHEISSYLPLLEGEEFDALVEDIKQFGQIEPAVLLDGKLIDGRNRYRACKQLGIELKVREWNPSEFTGMTPLQFVISENIMRRHLNEAQRGEIGMLLYPEIENEVEKERIRKISEARKGIRKSSPIEDDLKKTYIPTVDIVGKKVKVSGTTMTRTKKITEIAKDEPLIAEEWEKAKKGEQGVSAVYEKAKVIEEAKTLPEKERKVVLKEIQKGELPAKKLREIVKEKKETQERLRIAEEKALLRKQAEEMEKLYKRIEDCKGKIESFENAIKNGEARINVLSKDITKKYSQWKDEDPARILTELGEFYETLDVEIYNNQLKDLKREYDILMNPLKEKLNQLENEYEAKKKDITKQKKEKVSEIEWVENHQKSLLNEFEKIDFQKMNIERTKKDLDSMLKEYEEKYK